MNTPTLRALRRSGLTRAQQRAIRRKYAEASHKDRAAMAKDIEALAATQVALLRAQAFGKVTVGEA